MRRRILNKFSWYLVLLAGLFQMISYALDQGAIQIDQEVRKNQYLMVSLSESRSAYLQMNNRVGDFLKVFEDIIIFSKASKFNDDTKKFLYFSIIFDQTRLIEDVIRDDIVKENFKNKKISFETKDENANTTTEELNYLYVFDEIVKYNHELTEKIEKDPDLEPEYILDDVEYNNEFINDMIGDLGIKVVETTGKLKTITKQMSNNQLLKQKLLLLSVTTQLASLLFLLILFRNISKSIKN